MKLLRYLLAGLCYLVTFAIGLFAAWYVILSQLLTNTSSDGRIVEDGFGRTLQTGFFSRLIHGERFGGYLAQITDGVIVVIACSLAYGAFLLGKRITTAPKR